MHRCEQSLYNKRSIIYLKNSTIKQDMKHNVDTYDSITRKEKRFRPLEELNLIDNFLFQTILTQEKDGEELCRILLSTILGKKIRKVRIVAQQSILGFDTNQHGIRLDAYVEDISKFEHLSEEISDAEVFPDVYDIEPNNNYEKVSLPRRMRYYHGLIDTKHLNSGVSYDKLPNVVIIMILPYDPFDKNRMVYTIKNHCEESPDISYEDGAIKILLYTKGKEGNARKDLADMLKYIENTNIDNITNEDIHTIHKFVEKAKHRKEVGVQYMRLWEDNERLRAEMLAEGRAEGRAEGQAEERKESIRILVTTYQELNQTKEMAVDALVKKYALSDEDAKEYVKEHWK